MRTHLTGIVLLAVTAGVLIITTRWFFDGRLSEVSLLIGAFVVVVGVLGLLIALVPAVRRAFTDEI